MGVESKELISQNFSLSERDDHLDKSTTYLSAGYAALDEEKSDYGSGIEDNHSLAFVMFEVDESGKLGLKPVSKIPLESRYIAQRIARRMQKKRSNESDKREEGEDFYEIPPGSAVLMGRDGEDPMMLLPDGQIISIPPHFLEEDVDDVDDDDKEEEEEECATGEGKTIEPIHSFDGIAGSTCSDSGVFESNQSHVLSTVRKSLLPVIPHSPRQASQREIDVADSASVEKEYNVTDSVAAEGGVKVNREERFVEKEQRRELLRDLNGRLDDVHLHENDHLSSGHHLENDRPDHLHDDSGSDGGLSGNSGNGSINGLSEEEKLALWRREYREKHMQQMEVAWEQYKELKKREEEEEKRKEEIRKEKTKKIDEMMEQTGNTESEAAIASSTSESISERNDNKTTKLKSVEASSPSTDVFELTIADRSPVGIGSSAENATASESSDATGCASDDDATEETTESSARASVEDAPKKMTASKKKIKSLSKTKKRTEKDSSKTKKDDTGKTDEKKAKKKKKKAREDTNQSTNDSAQDVEESGAENDSEADDAKLKLEEEAEKSGTTVPRKVKASAKFPGAEENRISSVGSKREIRRSVGVDRATIGTTDVEGVEKESNENGKTKQREADRRKRLEKWAEIAERRRREVAMKRQEEKERREAERLAAAEEELRIDRMKREEEQRLQDHIARRRQKMLEEREARERAEREADERREAEKRKQEMLRRQMEEMRLKLESEIIRRREEEARRLELARIEAEEEAERRLQEEAERLEWARRIAEETDETRRAELEAMRREAEEAARRREQERRQRSAEERDRIRRLEEEKQRALDKQSWYTEMASEALRTMHDLKINRAFTYSYFTLGQSPDFYAQDL